MLGISEAITRQSKAAILISGGVIMALAGAWFVYVHFDFLRQSERSQGTVVEMISERGARGMSLLYPRVQFWPENAGDQIVFRARPGLWPSPFETGDLVVVAYNPNQPADAKIVSFWTLWFLPAVMILFGGACVFAGRNTLQKSD
jgi:hypothetical protein